MEHDGQQTTDDGQRTQESTDLTLSTLCSGEKKTTTTATTALPVDTNDKLQFNQNKLVKMEKIISFPNDNC